MMWGVEVRNVGMTSVPRDWVASLRFYTFGYFGLLGFETLLNSILIYN